MARRIAGDALSKGVEHPAMSRLHMNETPLSGRFAAKSERSEAPGPQGRIGVLLINLGTPDGTSYWPMRRYLKEFLSDRRVIETNRVLWWLILNFVVLVKRPFASGAKYRSHLERGARRIPASHHHAEPGGEGEQGACHEEHRRRVGHALRLAVDRLARGGARRPGLRPAASPSRSIRNMPARPPRRPTTKSSTH